MRWDCFQGEKKWEVDAENYGKACEEMISILRITMYPRREEEGLEEEKGR